MSDTKTVPAEQIAELRAAIAAHPDHANVPSEECPRCAWQSKLGDVAIFLLDAAERCGEAQATLDTIAHMVDAVHDQSTGPSYPGTDDEVMSAIAALRADLAAAIARAEAAEKERDEIVSAIIGHDDEDMKHDLKSVAQLVKDVLVERDDLARRLGEAEHSAANFARWFTQAAQHLHIVQPIYLGRAQCDGAVRDAKAYLATLTTPPADGSGEGA